MMLGIDLKEFELILRQARQGIAAGVDILAPECAIPLATPNRNLTALVEAAEEKPVF